MKDVETFVREKWARDGICGSGTVETFTVLRVRSGYLEELNRQSE